MWCWALRVYTVPIGFRCRSACWSASLYFLPPGYWNSVLVGERKKYRGRRVGVDNWTYSGFLRLPICQKIQVMISLLGLLCSYWGWIDRSAMWFTPFDFGIFILRNWCTSAVELGRVFPWRRFTFLLNITVAALYAFVPLWERSWIGDSVYNSMVPWMRVGSGRPIRVLSCLCPCMNILFNLIARILRTFLIS